VLVRYAVDAAREVVGVRGLVDGHLWHRGVRLEGDGDALRLELHLAVEWGVSIPEVAQAVQARVREYLLQMANVHTVAVDVVVDEVSGH
jgi:uncharacterized alkaline shock family protein YloU